MHIEPGVVTGAKLLLGYVTAAGSLGMTAKLAWDSLRHDGGARRLVGRSLTTTALVFSFFELLPHIPVGVSEVHLILGSTLLLVFGAGPTAIGLVLGLLLQGLFFVPSDLPQYGMNVTTLIGSLVALKLIADRVIKSGTAYTDLAYRQVVRLSLTFQAVTVSWVAFWVAWGQGLSVETLLRIATFGAAYMSVILIEPLIDLTVLALAKRLKNGSLRGFFTARLYQAGAGA